MVIARVHCIAVTEVIKRIEGIRQVILEIAAEEDSLEVTVTEEGSLALTSEEESPGMNAAEESRDPAS
jgi:hypothetical protein